MISRSALLGGLLTMTLLAGLAVSYFHENSFGSGAIVWTELKGIVTGTGQHGDPAEVVEHLRSVLPAWSSLRGKGELTLYLVLALVAGSTIAFVLTRDSRKPVDPKDALLEVLKEEKKQAENSAKIK